MTATLYASKQAVSQQFAGTAELAGYIGTKLKGDYKGSSVWFHPVTDVFNQFPQMGWTPDDESGTVSFSGNGTFNGLMQLATQWELSDGTIAPVTQSSQREEIVAS
jgi:hypothetical protein